MKEKLLHQITKCFDTKCWDGENNAPSSSEIQKEPENTDLSEKTEETVEEQKTNESNEEYLDSNDYRGSKELNPNQMPLTKEYLKEVMTHKYDKAKIDKDIYVDPSIVSTEKEEEEVNTEKTVDADPNKEDSNEEETEEKKDEETKIDTEIDEDVKKFYEQTGLSEDVFNNLPETTQNYITELYEANIDPSNKNNSIEQQHNSYKDSVEKLLQDPIISARSKEISTGQAYIPKSVSNLTQEEYDNIDNAESIQERNQLIDKIIASKINPIVNNTFIEKQKAYENNQLQVKAYAVLKDIGKLDPEFFINEDNLEKINENHPLYETEFKNGLGKIIQYLIDKGENYNTISKKTSKEILAAYNVTTGRDQSIAKKIKNNAEKSILEKLKKPTQAEDPKSRKAKTIKNGGESNGRPTNVVGDLQGSDRSTLVEKVAAGDTAEFDKLGVIHAFDPDKLSWLDGIWRDGMVLRNKNR